MAVSFPRFSWCWWGNGKEKEGPRKVNSTSEWGMGLRESDNLRFSTINGSRTGSRKVKKKWHSREERKRVDKEYDVVLVPSDGVCLSGSESDESDWSIGWSEPHGPEFQSDNDSDNSFAVLVPCYSRGSEELVESPDNQLLDALKNLNDFSSEGKKPYGAVACYSSKFQSCNLERMSAEIKFNFLSIRKSYQQYH